mgnify:CR=1 FL=1
MEELVDEFCLRAQHIRATKNMIVMDAIPPVAVMAHIGFEPQDQRPS